MSALGLLAVLAAFLFVGYKLVAWTGRAFGGPASWLVLLGLLAAPFVDAMVGRRHLATLCERGNQITILDRVKGVDGIGLDYVVFSDSPSYWGYKYVEGGFVYRASHMIERVEGDADGKGAVEKKVTPRSRYWLTDDRREESFYYRSQRSKVIDRQTGQEIAHVDWYWFRGGWAERIPMAMSGAGPGPVADCSGIGTQRPALLLKMLHASAEPAPR